MYWAAHFHCHRLIFIMLTYLLSRGLCQLASEVKRRSNPTIVSAVRSFTTSNPTCGEESASDVTYSQLRTMLSNRDIQLFDVRNPDEYQAGYIPHAVNIPLGNLEDSLKLSPDQFQQRFGVMAPGKNDSNIVFYCRSGNRSTKALGIANQQGLHRARHYKGGYTEWEELQGK